MNPCPVHDAHTSTVFLFFIAVWGQTPEATQIATGRNAARLCCVTSHDGGHSWGQVRDLTEEAVGSAQQDWATFAVGPGHGVQLGSGRLLVPAYTYRVDRRECFGRLCRTSPHAFAFYSDDHGHSWSCGGLVPNLRSGECQLAAVGGLLYCNARSPLGSRVQALSTDEGTSFLPGELVPSLAETARGCQGSILGFPAPPSSRPLAEGDPWGPRGHPPPPLYPGVQRPPEGGAGDSRGSGGPGGRGGSVEPPRGLGGDTWLLYSHPVGRRARLHMGVHLSRDPLDPQSWSEPWVIHEGPSGYSDLACVGPLPQGAPAFACVFESGARLSYEEVSFCLFSLQQLLRHVGPLPPRQGAKPGGHCQPS
ncbi:sialidase-4 isoform X2 [Sorex araneus]|nr:sialidase-4 isoform X2 [Sorex araneus]